MGELREKFRKIPWGKIGWGLAISVLMILLFVGGYLIANWYFQRGGGESPLSLKYAGWQVYKNETYNFGLRYPNDWEVWEVSPSLIIFTPTATGVDGGEEDTGEGQPEKSRGYISLSITPNETRGQTACEEDQRRCSFRAGDIFGERITTPETETVFFSRGTNDFTLTLYRYDASDDVWAGLVTLFEGMAESFRFTTKAAACEKDADCVLGIRLDECCSCPEAFTASAIADDTAVVPYEVGKDYSKERLVDCSGVYCGPCPIAPSGVSCVSGRCQVKE